MSDSDEDKRINPFAPLIAAVLMGILLAIAAIGSQGGFARGYSSVLLLFLTFGLCVAGVIAGIVAMALGKFQLVFELIGSAILLPVVFISILFDVGLFNGEYAF